MVISRLGFISALLAFDLVSLASIYIDSFKPSGSDINCTPGQRERNFSLEMARKHLANGSPTSPYRWRRSMPNGSAISNGQGPLVACQELDFVHQQKHPYK